MSISFEYHAMILVWQPNLKILQEGKDAGVKNKWKSFKGTVRRNTTIYVKRKYSYFPRYLEVELAIEILQIFSL